MDRNVDRRVYASEKEDARDTRDLYAAIYS